MPLGSLEVRLTGTDPDPGNNEQLDQESGVSGVQEEKEFSLRREVNMVCVGEVGDSASRLASSSSGAKTLVPSNSAKDCGNMFDGNRTFSRPLRVGPRVDNNKMVHTTKVRIEARLSDLRRNPLKVTKGVQPGSGKFGLNSCRLGFIPPNPQTGCTCRNQERRNREMKKTEKRAALYVRVSTTNGQSTELQEEALREYAQRRGWAYKVYADRGESGAKERRPGLDALLTDARRRKVDVVVVWALDRLARSLKQLLTLLDEWRTLGVDFVSYKQELDTSTAAGRMIFQVLGAMAEFERELIRERVRAGVARARREGKRVGRPALRKFSRSEVEKIRLARREKKLSVRQLAGQHQTTQWMIGKILAGKYAVS